MEDNDPEKMVVEKETGDDPVKRVGDVSGEDELCDGGDVSGEDDPCGEGDVSDLASAALLRRAPPLLGAFLERKLSVERAILQATAMCGGEAARNRAALAAGRVKSLETILNKLAK
jgi:hypothetical protein